MNPRRTASIATALILALGLLSPAAKAAEGDVIRSHGISSFGDLKYPAEYTHFVYAVPGAPQGGKWSGRGTSASSTFDSLHPFILKGEAAQGLGLTFEGLLTGSADEADSAYGLIAKSMEYPEDRSWVIFEMREEARFSDGSPITAEDVVFSFEILRDKGAPSYKLILRDVESAEALAPLRVKFTFREGALTRDLPSLVGGLSIMSKAWWSTRDFEKSSLEPILGSGPYEVAEAKPGRSVVYKRRADYWGWDHPSNVGRWNFDDIVYEYFKDYTAAFEAFKGGAFLFHEEFFSKIWATGYDFPAIRNEWVLRDTVTDGRPSGTQGFWINMRRDQFKDPRVREAIALGFDFEWSNEKLFYGLYKRTDSMFENSPMEATGMPGPEELALLEPLRADIPETVFTEAAYSPPVSNGSGSDRKLLRRAMKLLDAAGWTVQDGVRKNAAGEVLRLELLDDSPTFERIIGPYISNLKKMGVDATLRIVDAAQYQARQEEFDYDIVPGRFVMSLTPGNELRSYFSSASVDQRGTPNLAGVSNPAVDALVEHVIGAVDRDDLHIAARALDRVLRAMHIWTPNWYKGAHTIAYWDVYGRPEVSPPYARGDMDLWWWDADKFAKLKAEGAL
jgi:microcin C transport system substrate-binding protein